MSGVVAIRYLLSHNAALVAVVPAESIMAGELPIKTDLPAISVDEVDDTLHQTIRVNPTAKMHIERVQVTVLCKEGQSASAAAGYTGVNALLDLALTACQNQRGTINGITVDSIVPDIKVRHPYDGVDLIHSGSRDFIVRWIG
jgi:hypothetical protein